MKTASGQVQRAGGIDTEVGMRLARGPVVGGLGGGMDDDLDPGTVRLENALHRVKVADVNGVVRVVRERGFEELARGGGRGFRAEKARAHVVVDSGDSEALRVELLAGFGAGQASGASDEGDAHGVVAEGKAGRKSRGTRKVG